MDSLNEIFANRLPRFYHIVNPTAEMVPVQIYIVDDIYEKQCELRPDRDPDLIPNGNGYNGITVVPHLVEDPINILFDINKIKQYSEDGSMTWVGTFGHEYTHAIDFYQMAKREALDSYDPLEETDKYYLFQMWTEYHARKKGYGFLRAFFNVDSDSDSRGERLQHIQEIEWPFHENRFYTEYHERGVDQIYLPRKKVLDIQNDVTWSRRDSYCVGQYAEPEMPEELPTAPVTTRIQMIVEPEKNSGFEKFDFDEEVVL